MGYIEMLLFLLHFIVDIWKKYIGSLHNILIRFYFLDIKLIIVLVSLFILPFQYIFQSRIMIELKYMLSYGAAEPSLRLLWKFKLLEFLLPVHVSESELPILVF